MINKNKFTLSLLLSLVVITSVLYSLEFNNIESSYVEKASEILISEGNQSFDKVMGDFLWEYRGLEMIIIAFILLCLFMGNLVLIKKSNNIDEYG